MSAHPPPVDPKDRAPDEILIAPTEDRDPPDDPPGQDPPDLKDDPKSSTSPKKTPPRRRYRLKQDPGGPAAAPGASSPLNDEAPMNALIPDRTKKATTTKSTGTKAGLPKSVTKPEVQRHHNLSATVVRGPKVEDGEVCWYWRIDRCANPALGVTKRETVYHKWATVTDAQSELADLVIRGAHRPQLAVSGRRIVTFANLIDADAAVQGQPANIEHATLLRWASHRRWLHGQLGHKVILQTTREELERLFVGAIRAGRAHITVERALKMLTRAWQWAYDERLLETKPPKVSLGRALPALRDTPLRPQIRAIVEALEGEEKLVVEVLAVTGARIGELVTLRRCDYDPQTHWLTVNGKTGARRVPIDPSVQDRLAARADGSTAPLFEWTTYRKATPTQGDKWVRRALARVCKRLGLPRFSPHGFRRAAVDFFLELHHDPKLVAVFLGHSVKVLMQYYRSPGPESLERMVASARPGDFSTTSSDRRRALDILPGLLKDEALMANQNVREAIMVVLSALGAGQGEKSAREEAPTPFAVSVTVNEEPTVRVAEPAATAGGSASRPSQAPKPASPEPTQARPRATPPSSESPRRPAAPTIEAPSRPSIARPGTSTTTAERPNRLTAAPTHRGAAQAQGMHPGLSASSVHGAVQPRPAPESASSRPPDHATPRHLKRPPNDKYTKG